MKTYVEAYYADGSPLLGNLDGQTMMRARNYKRTKHYRALRYRLEREHKVAYYQIIAEDGRVLETITT